jgi:hypothetical protein
MFFPQAPQSHAVRDKSRTPKKTPIWLLPAAGVYNAALLHHAGQDC